MNEFFWERKAELKQKISEIIILDKDEEVMMSWDGSVETFEKTVVTKGRIRKKHKIVEAKGEEKGTLIITDRRLLWVTRRGRLGKTYRVTHEIPIESIRSISGGGKVKKYISLIFLDDEYIFRLSGKYHSLNEFRNIVRSLRDEWEKQIEAEKQKERVHIMLDFTALADHMKDGGLSLKTIKCTECGGPLDLPESGNQISCEHCGCTIHAEDIFEKIKALIG